MGCYYLYDDWGSSNYDDACQGPYYLYRAEHALLRDNAPGLVKAMGGAHHWVDLGCGTGNKIVDVLNAASNHGTAMNYYPVDISTKFLSIVQQNLKLKSPDINVVPIAQSYNEQGMITTLESHLDGDERPKIFSIFGGELMCMDHDRLETLLARLRDAMKPTDRLFVGYDPQKTETQRHVDSYDSEESHVWFKNIVLGLGQFLGTELNPDDFDYVPMFVPSSKFLKPYKGGIVHYLRCRKSFDIKTMDGTQLYFEEGELMYMLHSAKPTVEDFQELMKSYGFETVENFADEENLMSLAVLKVEDVAEEKEHNPVQLFA